MEVTQLAKIKRRLGIDPTDNLENDLLTDLVEDAESYFKGLTGTAEIASKYNFMIENVVYKLYGRKGCNVWNGWRLFCNISGMG